ncbi:MAG: DUF4367 domain-containing protein [Clostridia bacterium]|nr:DUF4367 domain-containing protein [Clostridia bacterium]
MTSISDFELSIALKVASSSCLEADVAEFLNLNTENFHVSPNVEKRVSRKLGFDEWKAFRKGFAKTVKIAMLVLVCGAGLFFATAMSISPVRASFFGAIVTWYNEYFEVKYDKTPAEENEEITDNGTAEFVAKKPTYVPEGFDLVNEYSSYAMYFCDYLNSNTDYLSYSQYENYEDGVDVDNSIIGRETLYLKDGAIEAELFIYENNKYILIWKDRSLILILSEGLELDEVIKFAEGIE